MTGFIYRDGVLTPDGVPSARAGRGGRHAVLSCYSTEALAANWRAFAEALVPPRGVDIFYAVKANSEPGG